MKVKQEILGRINNPQIRTQIAGKIGTGETNVYLAIKRNAKNGRMTKLDFLNAVSEVLNVGVSEILEDVSAREGAQM